MPVRGTALPVATELTDDDILFMVNSPASGAETQRLQATLLRDYALLELTATSVPVDTSTFVGNLGAGDGTVQAALETIDLLDFASQVESVNDLTGAVVLTADIIGAIDASLLGVASGVAGTDLANILDLVHWPQFVATVNGLTGEVILDGYSIPLDSEVFTGNLSEDDATLQLALQTIDALDLSGGGAGLADHLADTVGAHAATAISFTPTGTIAATTVQAAIAEVASEASAATIDASSFAQNLTTADNTLAEVAARYNTPDRFAVDYDITLTATPTEWRQGTALRIDLDMNLNYDEGGGFGPNYALPYQSAAWDGWKAGGVADPGREFPTGVVTLVGENTFSSSAGLLAGGIGFMEYRVSKNPTGVARNITNYNSFINNHIFFADGAAVDWFAGSGSYIVGLTNYGAIGFSSQPVFAVHNVNGGTMDNASNTDFYSGPVVLPGVTMANRWGLYIDDANDSYAGVDAIELGGVIERAVGIQINELVTADDYNIPINYGDPNVANAPLFRVNDDGQVVTPGIKGLNNLIALAPAPSSTGVLVVDAANAQYGPVSGYTHTSTNLKQFELRNTYTMNATTGTLANAWFGLAVGSTIIYDQNNNASGSAGYLLNATFENKTTEVRALTAIYGAFLAPTVTVDAAGCTATAITGVYSAPIITRSGSGTITVDNVVGFQAVPQILTGTTVTDRYGIRIDGATVTGTLVNQYGISISTLTGATTLNIGILNAASTILTGGLWGSQASGGDLAVHATTHATTGTIQLFDEVEQRPTDQTFTATPKWMYWDNAYTMNMATAVLGSFFDVTATVIMQQSGSGFGAGLGINFAPTVKNTGSTNLGLWFGATFAPALQADTTTALSGSYIGVRSAPEWSVVSTGTITSGTTKNFSSTGSLVTGITQTAWTHYDVADVTGSGGTLTLQIGLDIPALSKGATNYGVRSLSAINILAALYGSTSSGGHLPLRTTTDATKGDIQLDNPTIELFVTDYTNTAATYTALFADRTVTMDNSGGGAGSGNSYTGVKQSSNIVYNQQGNIFVSAIAYQDANTYKNTSATAITGLGPITSFLAGPTLNLDTSPTLTASYTGFSSAPALTRTTSGTLTVAALTGFSTGGTVATGTAITTRTGLLVSGINSALVTTQIGVDVAALTTAGTNIGIRTAAPYVTTPTTKTISAAGDTFAITSPLININTVSGGGITLTAAAIIPDTGATEGQWMTLVNTDAADSVTFTEGNDVKLGGGALVLGPGDVVTFVYLGSVWREVCRSANAV